MRARRPRRLAVSLGLAIVGLGLGSSVLYAASDAAFTATTTNGVNTFEAGTLALDDNDAGNVLFDLPQITPGDTLSRCIRISYGGDITSSRVRLYASSGSAQLDLDQYLDITVEAGSVAGAPAFPDCTGFVSSATVFATDDLRTFRTTANSFANGIGEWAPTGAGQTRDYRFTYTFQSSAPGNLMGASAEVTFTWETQAGS